jgi:2-polyprenyl-3-methyl-5-hydroxy-6-metoxy-1,4-benzoquinol methylase
MDYDPNAMIRPDTSARHLLKYSNRNPFHRLALDRFFTAVSLRIRQIQPKNVFEFGCGEGFFLQELKNRGLVFDSFVGLDLRRDAIEMAKELHPEHSFVEADFLSWDYPVKSFDLVIASQVLEHLAEPEKYLERLVAYSGKHLLLTVPWEPWFRLMNLLRGRDINRLGNHPEHINQWGIRQFESLVAKFAYIQKTKAVFPFIIVSATVQLTIIP